MASNYSGIYSTQGAFGTITLALHEVHACRFEGELDGPVPMTLDGMSQHGKLYGHAYTDYGRLFFELEPTDEALELKLMETDYSGQPLLNTARIMRMVQQRTEMQLNIFGLPRYGKAC